MARDRVRLKDIAQATGYSANTVSLALRASPRIPEETRARIEEEARRLNYVPDRIARSLVSRATHTIGLVMPDIMNPTLTLAAQTIETQLTHAGYGMMFAVSNSSQEQERQALERFQSYRVDGILVYPARHAEIDHIHRLRDTGLPVILLADLPWSGLDVVTIDDRAGARKAVGHLIARGHRRVAFLDGGRRLLAGDKLEGARDAIREAGLPADTLAVLDPAGHSAAHGIRAVAAALALVPRITALFASTDSLAIGALHWCRENGLAVPRDLAIVGYDNTEAAAYCSLPLTTVNYAADVVSRLAVRRMIEMIETDAARAPAQVTRIEPDLVVRDST